MPSKGERLREVQRAYKERHRESINARRRAAYAQRAEDARERTRQYRREHPAAVLEYNARWRKKFFGGLRAEFIAAYGGRCACCGESESTFLDLDHVNNDGAAHRREIGNNQRLLVALKRDGWPKGRVQILCCNCNQGKARNGGVCPHESRR
jgi:hypothetical protein